ncbi:MAG TPA: polyhydroxyalkanoic acid system family protein [Thermoanaerobaculia bacterium]|nr:polyhydroxyalkanoic acid system family protein [Thermoanaerobaculia bacterium]
MSDLTIETPAAKSSMADLRPALDAALKANFPGGMLKWSWDGDVCHLTGPGAKGTIVLEEGKLVGRAHLAPPASMMRSVIEQKISTAMKKAAA